MQKNANHDSESGEFSVENSLLDDPALLEQVGEQSDGDEDSSDEAAEPTATVVEPIDELKSVSSGFASLSYETIGMRPADVVKLELLVAEEPVPAFARVVSRMRVEEEAEKAVEKLHSILPKQLFTTKIQGRALGRIISSRTIAALKKNVTINLYGGDITRKRKLWEKQKKGKERLKERGRVNIPQEVFLKMMRGGNNN